MTRARDTGDPWAGMAWTSEPRNWRVDDAGVGVAASKGGTDFWQKTYYGFARDDGHALLRQVEGAFSAVLAVEGDYAELYDQAGLMLRAGPERWIKFGIELTDGLPHVSVVATDGVSDWSARPCVLAGPVKLRATRLGATVLLQHRAGGADWQMARLAPFTEDEVGVGPYLCAPERAPEGAPFEARFSGFVVSDPAVTGLHG